MRNKETKQRICDNQYKRIQRRQLRFLRKYFINSLLIPMPVVMAAGGLKADILKTLGFDQKQIFLSTYAIGFYPASRRDPQFINGQFIRSQRDPSFCTFLIDMAKRRLVGLSVHNFSIDLVERRKEDLARRQIRVTSVTIGNGDKIHSQFKEPFSGQPPNTFFNDMDLAQIAKMVDEAPSASFIETQKLLQQATNEGGIKRGELLSVRALNPNMYKTHFTHRLYEQLRESSKDYKLDGIVSEELLNQKIKFRVPFTDDYFPNLDRGNPDTAWVALDSFAEGLSASNKDDKPKA